MDEANTLPPPVVEMEKETDPVDPSDEKAEDQPKAEDEKKVEDESSTATPDVGEATSQKRKLEEACEPEYEDEQCSKKMKLDDDERTEKEEKEEVKEEAAQKEDGETQPGEGSDVKVKEEGGEVGTKPAEDGMQETQMDVDQPPAVKQEEEETKQQQQPQTDLKTEIKSEIKTETDDSPPCKTEEPEVKEEKDLKPEKTDAEMSQRRYPTRNRGGEDKFGKSDSDKGKSGNSTASSGDGDGSASLKSDSGSDKENMSSDGAVDVSNAGTPDVIMLSDEDENDERKKRYTEKKAKTAKLVRRLQTQLRNEEAKLVLLKKLRQSQLTPQVQEHQSAPNTNNNQVSKQAAPRQQGGPPPLVRGNQQGRSSNLPIQPQQNRTSTQGQMRNTQGQGPPPLVGTPRSSSNNTNGHNTPNSRNSTPIMNQHSASSQRSGQQQPQSSQQQAATPPQPPVDTQTPAQRQAAAKLALRKQLEKTLLQIPPPKPPAPEMNFIPSLACPDFVLLLGLEEVVNHIIDLQLIARGQKSPDEKFICNPFTCVQCGTDYTPVWKREKPGSKNVICEHCVTWNQKRALKQEHTNRLKSAFVKALQQEQEIERMQAQTPTNSSTPTPSVTPPTSSSPAPPQALAAAANNIAAAAAMSMNPASFRSNAEQVRQHHNFLQQAQLRAGQSLSGLQGFGSRSSFPYNMPYVKPEVQRQYLLDMMPRGSMPWKP